MLWVNTIDLAIGSSLLYNKKIHLERFVIRDKFFVKIVSILPIKEFLCLPFCEPLHFHIHQQWENGCKFEWKYNKLRTNTAWKVSVFGVLLVRIFLGVFLVRIFPHSDWIRRDTPYVSIFIANAGKYGPEKLRIRTLFT